MHLLSLPREVTVQTLWCQRFCRLMLRANSSLLLFGLLLEARFTWCFEYQAKLKTVRARLDYIPTNIANLVDYEMKRM